ncbi:MAG TPA: phosphoribosyltransferase family protein, partial [Propionicimonas sp.]|nr:phosphoribosyltransferase family protein [Propionicimonas sp.]
MDAADIAQDLSEVLYSRAAIEQRLAQVAAEIDADYDGLNPLLVGVLNGAVMVMADLSRNLESHVEMDWMAVSSYGAGTKTSG